MLYSFQRLLHKIGLYIGPGEQPGDQGMGAVRDRNDNTSATYDDASTSPEG